jgi:cell division protein FtsQ
MALASLGLGLQALGRHLLDPARFPLRHVRLSGELRNLEAGDMRAWVEPHLGQNFFALDIDAIHATVAAQPWIDHISVHRRWPDTLEIQFQERIAFGHWGKNEMVDINGRRFRPPQEPRQGGPWPRLAGPDGNEPQVLQAYREASARLGAIGLSVTRLAQDERRAWSMKLSNGLEVSLGREQFFPRLQRFIDIYPRILADQAERIAMVDLRYVNGFAVRWNDSPEAGKAQRVSNSKMPMAGRKHPASAG